jgi:hypothetical protein
MMVLLGAWPTQPALSIGARTNNQATRTPSILLPYRPPEVIAFDREPGMGDRAGYVGGLL